MKKLLCFAVLIAVLGLTAAGGFAKATVVTTNIEKPMSFEFYVPCALEGKGELVIFAGRLHVLSHTTFDNNGGYHLQLHFQPKDMKGTGQTSGDTYQATGVTKESWNESPETLPHQYTLVDNFRIIGQGPGNNYLWHWTLHFTVNANGDVTADFENIKVECK